MAHELGHVLTNNGHIGISYDLNASEDTIFRNLMRVGGSNSSHQTPNASIRITTEQEAMIHASPLLERINQ